MGDIRVSVTNAVTIGLMAYVGVLAINKLVKLAGKPQLAIGG